MGFSVVEKAICFTKRIDFPMIRNQNVEWLNLVHAHKPGFFLPLPFLNDFIALFLPSPLPFYSRYLLRLTFFLAAVKTWVLILGKAWKWDLDQL